MKKIFLAASAGLVILLIAFHKPAETADSIFINGKIITVDANNSIAQAVAVKDGKIVAVGKTEDIIKWKGAGTEVINLQGKTLTPGFVDGHSHFMSLGRSKAADVS